MHVCIHGCSHHTASGGNQVIKLSLTINDLKTHVYHNEVIPLAGQAVLQAGGYAKSKLLTNSASKIVNFRFLTHRPPKFHMSSDYMCYSIKQCNLQSFFKILISLDTNSLVIN